MISMICERLEQLNAYDKEYIPFPRIKAPHIISTNRIRSSSLSDIKVSTLTIPPTKPAGYVYVKIPIYTKKNTRSKSMDLSKGIYKKKIMYIKKEKF